MEGDYTRRKVPTEKSYLDAVGRSLWVDRCGSVVVGRSLWDSRCGLVANGWLRVGDGSVTVGWWWVGRYGSVAVGWSLWVGCCGSRHESVAVGRSLWVDCCESVAVGWSRVVCIVPSGVYVPSICSFHIVCVFCIYHPKTTPSYIERLFSKKRPSPVASPERPFLSKTVLEQLSQSNVPEKLF